MTEEKLYWHIAGANELGVPVLGHGDGRKIRLGELLTVDGELGVCDHGLHFCERLIDCLNYAKGAVICEVRIGGEFVMDGDKGAAQQRTVVRWVDAATGERIMREFARWCALQVVHFWDAPEIARQYLETGDESIRAAARDAAWDAASAAAWDAASAAASAAAWAAARDAAWAVARDAASAAASAAAWAAARDAASAAASAAAWAAAWDAASAAARDAARDAYESKFVQMFREVSF